MLLEAVQTAGGGDWFGLDLQPLDGSMVVIYIRGP